MLFTPAHHFCDIDQQLLQNKGFLNPHSRRSQLAQEMRRIKRPLLLNIQKAGAIDSTLPPANLIMITSALPGEGKTFISINLALSMASELDRRVLLVDADVARGDVSRQLELPPSRGLSDLLQESNYLGEDGVKTSNIERLSILPAGEPVDHIDELFASEMMSHITLALAEADPQRVVIFDAPPLIHTTEAAVLARRMGQTVVVVEANRTPQAAVRQALAQLEECPNVSLVLNKATGKSAAGYGYGYGYGSDGRSTSDEVAAGGRPQQPE
ncbi:MAG: AAA family ATPase [Pseudomonadales bacterium]